MENTRARLNGNTCATLKPVGVPPNYPDDALILLKLRYPFHHSRMLLRNNKSQLLVTDINTLKNRTGSMYASWLVGYHATALMGLSGLRVIENTNHGRKKVF